MIVLLALNEDHFVTHSTKVDMTNLALGVSGKQTLQDVHT